MNGLLCLKWNNHSSAFYKTLNHHRTKELYCDTTIACRGKYYPVHRLVLTTCSEYFEEIFERTQCKHPFIIIKDIQPAELEALLNYMYKGEVNVLQDMLPGLIKAAEALKIKGLAVPDEDGDSGDEINDKKRSCGSSPTPHLKRSRKNARRPNRNIESKSSISQSPCIEVEPDIIPIETNTTIEKEPLSTSSLQSSSISGAISQIASPKSPSSVYIRNDASSNLSHEENNMDKRNSENLEADNGESFELNDVKVEAVEIDILENNEENQYSLSDTEVDTKSEAEGSLFQTLLGADEASTNNQKSKSSSNTDNHPVAQCSTWDEQLDNSNDDSHLNEDDMEDEMSTKRRKIDRIYQEHDQLVNVMFAQDKFTREVSINRPREQDEEWNSQKFKKCPHCCYITKYKSNLTTHILRKHTTELAFGCLHCEYRCSTKASLKVHTRKHTGEKPYQCDICPYKAGYYDSLKKHMMVHTGVKPYKCKNCSYSTTQKHTLSRHMDMYHSSKKARELCAGNEDSSEASAVSNKETFSLDESYFDPLI